jgi:hypothetical protein
MPPGSSVPEELKGDPVSIARHMIVHEARSAVSFPELRKLHRAERPLSFSSALEIPELCLDENREFVIASRFFSGNLAAKKELYERLARHEGDPSVSAKWALQAERFKELFPARDPYAVTFGMRQKWIPLKYLAEFLESRHFSARLRGGALSLSGLFDPFVKNLARYLQEKSLSGTLENINQDRKRIDGLESDFNEWMRSHQDCLDLCSLYNRCFNSSAAAVYESDPLDLDDLLSGDVGLHGYQRAEIRRLAAEGGGVCAYGVGLGKTLIALGLHAWGRRHGLFTRTLIVAPSSVMGNWRGEAGRFFHPDYARGEILCAGVAEGGSAAGSYNASQALSDLKRATAGGASLVVVSKEKFAALRLSPERRKAFSDYALEFCPGMGKALGEFALGEGDGAWPYLEDFGFDNVIIDEAHVFKNCLTCSSSAGRIAYLSIPPVSKNALNAAAKAFAVRNGGKGRSYALTATPVTNSPFEIFNMLALVTDLSVFREMGVETINDVVRVFGRVNVVARVKVSGEAEETEALLGFVNLDGLRTLFNSFVHFDGPETAGDSFSRPEANEKHEYVALEPEQEELYKSLRDQALEAERGGSPGTPSRILSIIRDMDRLTLDIDTYKRQTTYLFEGVQEERLRALAGRLPRVWAVSAPDEETGARCKKETPMSYLLRRRQDGLVSLTVPEDMDSLVDQAVSSLGIPEGAVSHPLNPKYRRLAELLKEYHEKGGKQLVFTEEKTHHRKLRRIISKVLEIDPSRVGIINASESQGYRLEKTIRDYNSGRADVVVANRKAELGVNLQTRTTAIHHLTLPWTPASIQQRNGRGIRQGNLEDEVAVHYYFGEKTFDAYRHTILEMKANWINELLEGGKSTMANAEAPDMEEILDLLSDSPEEAERRREERRRTADEYYRERQREGVFRVLRAMTELRAAKIRVVRRQNQVLRRLDEEHQKKISEMTALEREKERAAREPVRPVLGLAGGLARKEELELKLASLREAHEKDMRRRAEEINSLARRVNSIKGNGDEYRRARNDLALAKAGKEEKERDFIRTSAAVNKAVRELSELLPAPSAPQPQRAQPAADGWREDLESQREAAGAEVRRKIAEAEGRDERYIRQNLEYFKELDAAGKLPFPLGVLDELGSFIISSDNQIVRIGDRFLRRGGDFFNGIEVREIYPEEMTVKADVYDPIAGRRTRSVNVDALVKYERLEEGDGASFDRVAYGKLPESKIFTKESFEKYLPFIKFDLSRGLILKAGGKYQVVLDGKTPPPAGAVPVWPDLEDPNLIPALAGAWFEAGAGSKTKPSSLLPEDLLGDDFESVLQRAAGRKASKPEGRAREPGESRP